jgi:ornithine--oxo-acid transaminase
MVNYLDLEKKYGAQNYKPLPVVIAKGEGCWVWDTEGKKYLDMLASYSAVNQGHRHPTIIAAAMDQLGKITVTSRAFVNDQMGRFLKKSAELAGYEQALPMNTGAEAVESAIKMARKWGEKVKGIAKDQCNIIVCSNNFHGRTITIVTFSTEAQYREGFGPFTPGFRVAPFGNAEALEALIDENTCAILVEPIQGEGGVIIPPQGYLKALREIATRNHVLLMFDEIQVGLGRTGKMFCFEHENAKPDVLILAKALGGGVYPVSIVLADRAIMSVFTPGDHGSTFGGNPMAAAIGIASLDVLINEKLPERAETLGNYFSEQLRKIPCPAVKEIRSKGMMIGVEIKPEFGNARRFCEALMDRGILCKETHITTIRFTPPLVITKEELDWALERITEVFKELC